MCTNILTWLFTLPRVLALEALYARLERADNPASWALWFVCIVLISKSRDSRGPPLVPFRGVAQLTWASWRERYGGDPELILWLLPSLRK